MRPHGLLAAPLVAVLVTALAGEAPLPEGWRFTGEDKHGCQATTDTVDHGPTPKAFVLRCDKSTGTQSFGTAMQIIAATDYAGKRVRLSAQVQGQDVARWGGLWMRADTPGEKGAAFDNMAGRPLTGSFGWREAQVVLDIPADSRTLNFGFLLAGDGTLSATLFKLEVVPASVPTTGGHDQAPLPTRAMHLSPP